MLNVLIIVQFVLWIAGFFTNGFCFYNVMLIVPVLMFTGRKFGIYMKYYNIITAECLFLFFSVMWRLLFNHFTLVRFIIGVLIRVISIIICIYDDKTFVYVNEERKRL